MGFFDSLKNTVANKAGVKMLQAGSNILISQHTSVEPLMPGQQAIGGNG
ncbi:MAG: hypothetical protein MZV65_41705 [Chromatiales bacterium]|nr:hypothetical protein [Chromatiales bacterium]